MRDRHSTRVTAAALTAIAATLSPVAAQTASAQTASIRTASARSASATSAETAPTGTASASGAPACTPEALEATAYQAARRPPGAGTGAAIVEFTNVSARACVVRGHPTVAVAGNGSPERNLPLKVTRQGSAAPVRLAPGGRTWVKLTFVPVRGGADGYCASGTAPAMFPSLVVGLPGAGRHQVALVEGEIIECDHKVTVTAVSATRPS
ncbi:MULTISPECIES: DUF4232 domain-containing protein [Streptomyces]|uniref:DUF4232 domain-containing protein n=1 Tax=Streptomyces canarius TaxID=285453 RepID=A0ABQ3CLB4_9ACTN|nr:DUF4232 domain-containing protein [Streptomyces canarius]GHA24253.1 hypothetical protein GCM10010345_31360 [Streptomyces canarius]